VHGLDGHWQKTWTAENGKMWLRDFLPAQLLELDVKAAFWSYGWNAKTAFSPAVTSLVDEADILLDRINGERVTAAEKARPIVFIAHSLGGILVKKVPPLPPPPLKILSPELLTARIYVAGYDPGPRAIERLRGTAVQGPWHRFPEHASSRL
jgi:hypothetical protein